jgi:hypothetical protein
LTEFKSWRNNNNKNNKKTKKRKKEGNSLFEEFISIFAIFTPQLPLLPETIGNSTILSSSFERGRSSCGSEKLSIFDDLLLLLSSIFLESTFLHRLSKHQTLPNYIIPLVHT